MRRFPTTTAVAGMFEPMVRQRARIRFRKQGDLRLIGHRDLVRTMERLFRRAGLELAMSQGFHPKPRMSFPCALAVGIEGLDEVMELELAESYSAEELLGRLQWHALPGLTFRSVEVLPRGAGKARVQSVRYEVPVPRWRRQEAADGVARLMAAGSWTVRRPGKDTSIDLRRFVQELTFRDGVISMRLRTDPRGSAGPRDVLGALGMADLERTGVHLRRTGVEIER